MHNIHSECDISLHRQHANVNLTLKFKFLWVWKLKLLLKKLKRKHLSNIITKALFVLFYRLKMTSRKRPVPPDTSGSRKVLRVGQNDPPDIPQASTSTGTATTSLSQASTSTGTATTSVSHTSTTTGTTTTSVPQASTSTGTATTSGQQTSVRGSEQATSSMATFRHKNRGSTLARNRTARKSQAASDDEDRKFFRLLKSEKRIIPQRHRATPLPREKARRLLKNWSKSPEVKKTLRPHYAVSTSLKLKQLISIVVASNVKSKYKRMSFMQKNTRTQQTGIHGSQQVSGHRVSQVFVYSKHYVCMFILFRSLSFFI